MKNPSPPEVAEWIELTSSLRGIEQFALIGLTDPQESPHIKPSQVDVNRIVGENKCYYAGEWAAKHFRKALRIYCAAKESLPANISLNAGASIITALATSHLGLTVGGATGFLAWMLGETTKNWCVLYGSKKFEGDGSYTADESQFQGRFFYTYAPPIQELIEDQAYSDRRHKIHIYQPEESTGRFVPEKGWKAVHSIWKSFGGEECVHCIEFEQLVTRKKISAAIKEVGKHAEGDLELTFKGENTQCP